MTPWEGLVANRCGPFFVPIFPPLRPPIFSLSGGFYGGKVPEILPRTAPKNLPERGRFFESKYSKIPLKNPFLLPCAGDDSPWKGFNFERNRLVFGINSACRTLWKGRRQGELLGRRWLRRIPPEREDEWGKCRGFWWGMPCAKMPSEWEKRRGGQAEESGGKSCRNWVFWSWKSCWKWTSFGRQSDKMLRQSVRLKKDAYIAARDNSIFSQFLIWNFEFFLIFAGPEYQILRIIPRDCKNLE